jgi:hypothetical protein
MATLDWHVTDEGGVTLVSLLVTSERTQRVRVENCLDGPVWPPRSQGVPEAGWDGEAFEATVAAGDRLVAGYASPAEPAEPPAQLVPAGEDEAAEMPGPREVIRTLGDPRPPRDAVPSDGDEVGTIAGGSNEDRMAENGLALSAPAAGGRQPAESRPRNADGLEAWLDGVRDRLDAAEKLARVTSVEEATEAVASVGGAEDLATLQGRLEADRERLETLATESESLAARIDGVEVPVETLQQLA